MKQLIKLTSMILLLAMMAITNLAQQSPKASKAGATTQATDGGSSAGQSAKPAAATNVTPNALGYTNIFEDKTGKIGIGTPAPTSLLTVQGMIFGKIVLICC